METKNEYTTESVDIAAFLMVRGFRLLKQSARNDVVIFIFEDNGAVERTVSEFYAGGLVSAHEFAGAARRIKDIVWDFRRKWNMERSNAQTTRH